MTHVYDDNAKGENINFYAMPPCFYVQYGDLSSRDLKTDRNAQWDSVHFLRSLFKIDLQGYASTHSFWCPLKGFLVKGVD